MTAATRAECTRCGVTTHTLMLPTGPLCSRCRRDIAYHPRVCPECLELRPVAYPSFTMYNVLVCAACAGEHSVFACAECGREDHPYGATRCARCILNEQLTGLFTHPLSGEFCDELRPVFEELMRARRPQSVISWLQKPPANGARVLGQMARGEAPISHDTFQHMPAGRSESYLRDLLTATGVLPPYQPAIERMERWLDERLRGLPVDDAQLIGRYARWHHLRRLRSLAECGEVTKPVIYRARSNVIGAVRLSAWAAREGTTIALLTQPQLESYLAAHPGGRNTQQGFIAWLHRSKENTRISLPWRSFTPPEVVVSDSERWDSVERLLHDDTITLYARIGGLFMLLFAQSLGSIVKMKTAQVVLEPDGRVLVAFDGTFVEMPPGLDTLIRDYSQNRGTPTISGRDHGWLFPGRHPGSHLVTDVFRSKLVTAGIHPGDARKAAMFSLAGQVPAPVLADLIGVADKTAVKWAVLAARDWSGYVAQRRL